MQILALETSTTLGSCALWRDGELTELYCPPGVSHSETLLPLVRKLLADAGVGITALDGIAFGCGPGAFTGLRVACAAAQGLAVAADLPVLPVVTLEALAWPGEARYTLALIDARMGEVYAAAYRRAESGLENLGEIRVARPDELVLPEGSYLARGNALQAYPLLAERITTLGWRMEPEAMPGAAAVAALGARQLRTGGGQDAASAAPLYIRDKVAQTVAERLAQGGRA